MVGQIQRKIPQIVILDCCIVDLLYVIRKNLTNSFILRLQMSSISSEIPYNPYKYPPDYNLARIHQEASMPGKPNKLSPITCSCCDQKVKEPFKSWWNRSIEKDFNRYGGAVVSYFWLLKLYLISAISVITIYGGYLHYLSDYYCEHLQDLQLKHTVCSKLFGVWIITNQDLYNLIEKQGDEGTAVRYFTLRSIAFLILLVVNMLSLFVVKWFKVRYPTKPNIADFSLIFKNLKSDKIEHLLDRIRAKIGEFEYKQAFIIKKVQPFYTKYQQKIQCFYQCKIQENQKKYDKMVKRLYALDKFCSEHEESFYNEGNRAIIVFKDLSVREKIFRIYRITRCKQIRMFFSNKFEEKHGTYCEKCPRPEEIIWNNIGVIERQGFKLKVLSVFYFIGILAILIAILSFVLDLIYLKDLGQPLQTIVTNVVLLLLVAIALTFRSWMNRLSEMRFPNTYTHRTMFIVITTVLFHVIFYLLIPSLYLRIRQDYRGSVLNLISNQAINFIIVQVILAGFDLMYCCWNRKRGIIENEDKPVGCQKILHQRMQYPRFPIEFKLIILFKIWSFITFFAFHVPFVLLFIFLALIFLYVKDKMNLYNHYRMQVIDNKVEFNFLRIYSNIFTVYLYETFVFTQHNEYQITVGAVITLVSILFQTFYFTKLEDEDLKSTESFLEMTLEDVEDVSFNEQYEKFLNVARNDLVDSQIKEYLSKLGYGTMKTESSLASHYVST